MQVERHAFPFARPERDTLKNKSRLSRVATRQGVKGEGKQVTLRNYKNLNSLLLIQLGLPIDG